jgi:hypothetical protein
MKVSEINEMIDSYLDTLTEHAYQDYFKSMLKKWGVKSPSQLPDEKKKEFFKDIKTGWAKNKKS